MSSNEVIQEIKRRLNISDVISKHVSLKKRGKNLLGLCPFHHEKTPSFNVNPTEGYFKCFGCGAGGDVFTFLQDITGQTFPEILEILAQQAGVTLPKQQQMSEADIAHLKAEREKYAVMDTAQKFFTTLLMSPKGQRGKNYVFNERKMSQEVVQTFGLGYGGHFGDPPLVQYFEQQEVSKDLGVELGVMRQGEKNIYGAYENRVTFPIHHTNGRVIGFGGRNIEPERKQSPKYINSPETALYKKTEVLFNFHRALPHLKNGFPAVLVEGYFDVIAVHQSGWPTGIAPCGTQLTKAQVKSLKERTDQIILCLDADVAGQKAAAKSLELLLAEGFGVRAVVLPHNDPDTVLQKEGPEVLGQLIKGAPDALLDWSKRKMEKVGDNPSLRIKVIDRSLRWVSLIPRDLARRQYLSQLADLFNEEPKILEQELRKFLGRRPQPTPEPGPRGDASKPPSMDSNVFAERQRQGAVPRPRWTDNDKRLVNAVLANPAVVHDHKFPKLLKHPTVRSVIEKAKEIVEEAPGDTVEKWVDRLLLEGLKSEDKELNVLFANEKRLDLFGLDRQGFALNEIEGFQRQEEVLLLQAERLELEKRLDPVQEPHWRTHLKRISEIDHGLQILKKQGQKEQKASKPEEPALSPPGSQFEPETVFGPESSEQEVAQPPSEPDLEAWDDDDGLYD